jgi:hypothetical protein
VRYSYLEKRTFDVRFLMDILAKIPPVAWRLRIRWGATGAPHREVERSTDVAVKRRIEADPDHPDDDLAGTQEWPIGALVGGDFRIEQDVLDPAVFAVPDGDDVARSAGAQGVGRRGVNVHRQR